MCNIINLWKIYNLKRRNEIKIQNGINNNKNTKINKEKSNIISIVNKKINPHYEYI